MKQAVLPWLISIIVFSIIHAGVHYVDNHFQGNPVGTLAAPWQTIAQGMDHLQPGDTLYIRGDASSPRVYSEKVRPVVSGTAQNPIVIKAYPGEKVLIKYQSSEVLKANKDYYVYENLIFDHDWGTSDAIRLTGDYNVFRNCEVRNGHRDGFDIGSAHYSIIEMCEIHDFIHENVGSDAHGIVITAGNYVTFRHNQIYDCSWDCIQIGHGTAYHTQILENDLFSTPAMQGISENAVDVKSNFGGFIYGNKMHGFRRCNGADGSALKINHQADSMVVAWNEIYDCNGGLRLTAGNGPPRDMIVTNNVVHHLVDEGNYSVDGYGVQFDGQQNLKFYNNTFYDIPGPLFWLASNGVDTLDMRNNIFANTHDFHGNESVFHGLVTIAYNGWFNCTQMFTNQTHVITGSDPMFVNADGSDFRLAAGSPCIDAGDPAFGSNYPGGRIDLGAFEYGSAMGIPTTLHKNPEHFRLLKNYPNPFNPETTIPVEVYSLLKQAHFRVYNVLGQVVYSRYFARVQPGVLLIHWDGKNQNGVQQPTGIYFYVFESQGLRQMGRMHLVK